MGASVDDQRGYSLTEQQRELLARVAEVVVPGESAAFVERVLATDRPDWGPRVARALEVGAELDALLADEDGGWLVRLIAQGFYAGDGAVGNQPAGWAAVGWTPNVAGSWETVETPLSITPRADLADRYDCVIVGSGAGGGAAAQVLAESGRSVLVVETGAYPTTDALAHDHLRNPRSTAGLPAVTDPDPHGRPRVSVVDGEAHVVLPPDGGWSNNAFTVGGGTRVYGAQAWRFVPRDFAMASTYGVPEGSALADWPITYADLEPYYSLAEQRFGVSGGGVDPWHDPRSIPLPMPPLPRTALAERLAAAAQRLGWGTLDPPLLINSTEYQGRAGCVRCGQCVGFACPVEAKSGTHNTALPAALATGRCTLTTETTVERLVTNSSGRVTGVALVALNENGQIWRRTIDCEEVVVAAGATETPRLLLNSAHDREPAGLGNNLDQVGRYLQAHVYAGAIGLFDDEVVDLVGPGVSIATCDFRHGNEGIVGGGMLANEFVPTPAATYGYLVGAGLIPAAGVAGRDAMRHEARRMMRVVGPIQEVSSADSRVQVDRKVTDRFGNPVVRTSGSFHPEDLRTQAYMSQKAREWLLEAGAVRFPVDRGARSTGQPSGGQHQAGTCRMGNDPARSVTDPYGRVWGHDNVRIADASVHVTNGGVNPVLTVLAGSLRISEHLARS
jgi:choline dehydrogenase-like flavoprotein